MNLFDLFAKISLDTSDYEKAIKDVKKSTKELGNGLDSTTQSADDAEKSTSKLGSSLKSGLVVGAKVAGTALVAASTAIVAFVKQSVDAYAEYEQLVGGVDTLFGNASAKLQEYANAAFNTAGLSANEYMSTATSFAASLVKGLSGDTEKAAELANTAIIDMADNANKMGTDISMIQSAYQGFAKQNYTMLDNLKLGYGGTASEMAKLINESGVLGTEISVTAETLNTVSFDKIVKAIHIVQENMGITGTTAKEASTTIQGSISSLKAAWENFALSFSQTSDDVETRTNQLTEAATTAIGNLLPVVKNILKQIPEFVDANAGELIDAIIDIFMSESPQIINGSFKIISSIFSALKQNGAEIGKMAGEIISSAVQWIASPEGVSSLVGGALEVVIGLIDGLANGNTIMVIVESVFDLIDNLISELTKPQMIIRLVASLQKLVASVVMGVIENNPAIKALANLLGIDFDNINSAVLGGFDTMANWKSDTLTSIEETVAAKQQEIYSSMPTAMQTVVLAVDGKEFGRVTYDAVQSESEVRGTKLATR